MKALPNRNREILNYLISKKEYVPVKEISKHMQLSEKTIYRDLKVLEEDLKVRDIHLEKRPGVGISLVLTDDQMLKLSEEISLLNKSVACSLSVESRRMKILTNLLYDSPRETSINKLSEAYFISSTSIVNDLKVIEEWIQPFNLKLEKNKNGTRLIGREGDIRKAMVYLINELINEEPKIEDEIESRIEKATLSELVNHFGHKNVEIIIQILEETESRLGYLIGDPYYINMFTHLLICIKRLKKGKIIYQEDVTYNLTITDQKVYSIAKEMAEQIAKLFELTLPEEEIYFIYQYLISSGVCITSLNLDTTNLLSKANLDSRIIAKELIQTVSNIIKLDLTDDRQLYEGLIIHLKPMLNRVKYQIAIKNPLLEELYKEYSSVFVLVRLGILPIMQAHQLNYISQDEISYLLVHFQAAIEQKIKKIRVILVCSTGIGTSHLLKNRINRSFPEWEIVDVISASWLDRFSNLDDIDLIISTVKLQQNSLPVAYVSTLLNDADVKHIKERFLEDGITKETRILSFPLLKKHLHPSYILIQPKRLENEHSFKEILAKMIDGTTFYKGFLDKKIVTETKINNQFSVFLIDQKVVNETAVGINIIKGVTTTDSKLEIVIAFKDRNQLNELLTEIFSLSIHKVVFERFIQASTLSELEKVLI
ncbi:BglG family transcription antiterminator [Peribacillus simplex]|uniref:BglG family transcription antiterminator n=1 Tax=Peribacillus simplex TaxID=1478 RepID=UPI0011DCCA74|nr:transcription antiterminator [Peribacillus simplex]